MQNECSNLFTENRKKVQNLVSCSLRYRFTRKPLCEAKNKYKCILGVCREYHALQTRSQLGRKYRVPVLITRPTRRQRRLVLGAYLLHLNLNSPNILDGSTSPNISEVYMVCTFFARVAWLSRLHFENCRIHVYPKPGKRPIQNSMGDIFGCCIITNSPLCSRNEVRRCTAKMLPDCQCVSAFDKCDAAAASRLTARTSKTMTAHAATARPSCCQAWAWTARPSVRASPVNFNDSSNSTPTTETHLMKLQTNQRRATTEPRRAVRYNVTDRPVVDRPSAGTAGEAGRKGGARWTRPVGRVAPSPARSLVEIVITKLSGCVL